MEYQVVYFKKELIKKLIIFFFISINDFLIGLHKSEILCPAKAVVPEFFSCTAQRQGRWSGWDIISRVPDGYWQIVLYCCKTTASWCRHLCTCTICSSYINFNFIHLKTLSFSLMLNINLYYNISLHLHCKSESFWKSLSCGFNYIHAQQRSHAYCVWYMSFVW